MINSFVGKVLTDGYKDVVLGQPGFLLFYERLVHFALGYTAAEFDAVIMAWKEKVNYDMVRPTSVSPSATERPTLPPGL